jgi:hypothetical protein
LLRTRRVGLLCLMAKSRIASFHINYVHYKAGRQARADANAAWLASLAPQKSTYTTPPVVSTPAYVPTSGGYSGGHSGGYSGNYSPSVDGNAVWSGIKGIAGVIVVLVVLGAIFGGGDKKASTSTASASSSSSSTTSVSTPFAEGAADRQAWESWFNSLSDDYRAGADHWATVRNNPHHKSCPRQTSDGYRWGCLNAKQFFDSRQVDTRRNMDAEYWRGWNSI